jgi:hypothetical protein
MQISLGHLLVHLEVDVCREFTSQKSDEKSKDLIKPVPIRSKLFVPDTLRKIIQGGVKPNRLYIYLEIRRMGATPT